MPDDPTNYDQSSGHEFSVHSGPTRIEPTPWAIISLAAGLLATAMLGGMAFGSLITRVGNVETRLGDFVKEVRSKEDDNQRRDAAMLQAVNDMRVTIGQLTTSQGNILNSLDVLIREHNDVPPVRQTPAGK